MCIRKAGANAKAATHDDIRKVCKKKLLWIKICDLQIIDQYAYAAHFAFESGFDGVELSAVGNLGLFGQFLSERINMRTDQYGGSLENRARLMIEVIIEIRFLFHFWELLYSFFFRKRISHKKFVIGAKVSAIKFTPNGPEPNEEAAGLIALLQVEILLK